MITTIIYLLHRNKNQQQKFKLILEGKWKKGLYHIPRQIAIEIPSRHFCSHLKFLLGHQGFFTAQYCPVPLALPFIQCHSHRIHVLLPGVVCRGPGPVVSYPLHICLHPWDSCLLFCYAETFSLLHLVFQLHSGAQPRRGKTRSIDFRRSFSDDLWLFQGALWWTYNLKSSLKHFSNQGDVLFWEILLQLLGYSSFLHITTPSLDCLLTGL